MENVVIYRCTDHGSDATAYEKDGFFVVRAGSRFGKIRNGKDHMMLQYRRAIARDFAFDEKSLILKEDVKLRREITIEEFRTDIVAKMSDCVNSTRENSSWAH